MSKQWDDQQVRRELLGSVHAVADRARCAVKSVDIELITPAERAEASTKAMRYTQLAGQVTDPIAAANYRELASKALQEAGMA